MRKQLIRKKLRMEGYDYSENGYYFVTICTKNKQHFFGEIVDGKMNLNEYGMILNNEILMTPFIRKEITIDQYIIMPNHFHAIIIVSTGSERGPAFTTNNDITKNVLSNVIQRIKSQTTLNIRKKFNDYTFTWQKSFYDTIIRFKEELLKTREYIAYNPLKWDVDRNVVENMR